MDKDVKPIKSLNQLLQGEYMAVDAFNVFISKVEEEKVKKTFQQVQDNHRNNIKTLAKFIQDMGGQPDENIGLKGNMADMKINIELGSKADTSRVVKKAIEGETQGINMAEKVLRGNLEDKSRDIAGEILHKDRSALDKLRTLM
ncbi:DUF2383 domain-containing protein [Brassicibacter mesophilus]|uniref:DUF2383 domain-containing protein n=1 Tax=Brassicibacter mesophilus TaxID=745119 RepID=UPI003D1D4E60